jgi:hypothetical protein
MHSNDNPYKMAARITGQPYAHKLDGKTYFINLDLIKSLFLLNWHYSNRELA